MGSILLAWFGSDIKQAVLINIRINEIIQTDYIYPMMNLQCCGIDFCLRPVLCPEFLLVL